MTTLKQLRSKKYWEDFKKEDLKNMGWTLGWLNLGMT